MGGSLPRPVAYGIFRETTHPDGRITASYRMQGEAVPLNHDAFHRWLLHHKLGGPKGLGLSLLVIREVLLATGAIRECVIERRRGAVDGPLSGDPARVEFVGPARSVRLYAVDAQGRLTEAAPTTLPPLPHQGISEGFSGEEHAIREHFGQSAMVLDRRSPTLFEEVAGLSSIVHVREQDGETGCGVGWHGPMVYLLVGDFPRLDHGLALPFAEEEAVAAAVRRHDLVRHEMRFDPRGLGVVASARDGRHLFIVRPDGEGARVEPFAPGESVVGSNDQRRWIRYAEAHEGRIALDVYQDGASDELIVLTGDGSGQVWRHRIDPDGVEVACGPANETAVAMLYRASHIPGSAGNGAEPDANERPPPPRWTGINSAKPGGSLPEPSQTPDEWSIEDSFPDAAYHYGEAYRCLALRRSSAAVFHGMHVVVVGLRAIPGGVSAEALTDWSILMAEIDARDELPLAMRDALRRLRRVWHAPGLSPAEKYTEEEAETLLNAVTTFMRVVANLPAGLP